MTLVGFMASNGVGKIWLIRDSDRKIHFSNRCAQAPRGKEHKQSFHVTCEQISSETMRNGDQFCKNCQGDGPGGIRTTADLWLAEPTESAMDDSASMLDGPLVIAGKRQLELEQMVSELKLENLLLRKELESVKDYADMLSITNSTLFSDLNKMDIRFAAPDGMLF
jgi:hypothetical protein